MKKLTITIALMLVVALAMPAFGAGHGSFSDVPADHWAYNAINKLVAAGIVEGYPDGEYKGQQSMTRYEMAVMVSRALDNIVDEMEAMGEGLTTGQAEDVTAIVKSLMEKNTNEELSDAQAEEVADIVDALTFELRSELKVLGAEVDALGKDVDELAAKVDAMDVPQDNIEFGMDVTTKFEVANYDYENNKELVATMALWADGDALDLDLPSYDIAKQESYTAADVTAIKNSDYGSVVDADGNAVTDTNKALLEGDWVWIADYFDNGNTLTTADGTTADNFADYLSALNADSTDGKYFSWEDADDLPSEKRFWQEYDFNINGMLGDAKFNLNVDTITNSFMDEDSAFGYTEADSNNLTMDTALLTVQYGDFTAIAGDHEGVTLAPYFVDDEDLEGLAVVTNQFGWDWNFLVASLDDQVEDDVYGFTASKDMDYGTVTGKVYQARLASDQVNVVGLAVSDVALTDVVTVGGEVAFNDNTATDSDIYAMVNGEFVATEELTLTGKVETLGEDFDGFYDDLEEANNYNLFNIGAEYVLNENNTVTGAYTFVDHDQTEDKSTVELGWDNVYGDFTNMVAVEYTMNDEYTDGYETRVIELGTEYAWNETTTLGAALVNKNEDNDGSNVINYNYLKGTMDKELADNMTWNTEAKYIMGEVADAEVEGEGSALTTSLSVNF